MKTPLRTLLALLPFAAVPGGGAAAQDGLLYCPPCPVQSKTPSATRGQFDYQMKCSDKVTHNSAVISVTAKNDDEALHKTWRSPRLDEIIVGLEAAAYNCAEPPTGKK